MLGNHRETPAMHPTSVTRYWRMVRIEEERVPLMAGMIRLMNAHTHLQSDFPPSEVMPPTMEQISSLIGAMEDENKTLSQDAGDLWRAILEIDGPELTSREIETRQAEVAAGIDWLVRAMRRLAENWPDEEGKNQILMEMADLRNGLYREDSVLRESQREYQLKRAETLARQALGDAN
jgi:hypothetical protein